VHRVIILVNKQLDALFAYFYPDVARSYLCHSTCFTIPDGSTVFAGIVCGHASLQSRWLGLILQFACRVDDWGWYYSLPAESTGADTAFCLQSRWLWLILQFACRVDWGWYYILPAESMTGADTTFCLQSRWLGLILHFACRVDDGLMLPLTHLSGSITIVMLGNRKLLRTHFTPQTSRNLSLICLLWRHIRWACAVWKEVTWFLVYGWVSKLRELLSALKIVHFKSDWDTEYKRNRTWIFS
jgi:hypothetical protein